MRQLSTKKPLSSNIILINIIIATLVLAITISSSSSSSDARKLHFPKAHYSKRNKRSPQPPPPPPKPPSGNELEDAPETPTRAPECGLPLLRLPKRLKPTHYDLMIMPNLSSLTFEGAVQINLDILSDFQLKPDDEGAASYPVEASQIVLHADESLEIDNIWYRDLGNLNKTSADGSYVDLVNVCRDPEYQLLVISLAKELRPNTSGELYLTFAGVISDEMRGLYKSSYQDFTKTHTNSLKYLATTQFQAIEARKAFPCFDEPALKATFDVSLIHDAELESHSNMEVIFQRLLPKKTPQLNPKNLNLDQRLVRFGRSPPMSTYLVAFVVGQFDHLERKVSTRTGRPMTFGVYTPPGKASQGAFALATACGAYPFLEEYLAIEWPQEVRKLDLVSISDFEAGAMENWGLVTFKDQQLLVDPDTTTAVSRALVGATVVHELTHHWFGNLVTMNWWNDLWLQEGFATWFEQHIMERLYPELEYRFHYLLDSHIHALNQDSFRVATHPVRPEPADVSSHMEIDDFFDAISYNKAAAIIRSLHDDLMKPEPFRKALQQYLTARSYSSATTEDLWHYMDLNKENKQQLSIQRYLKSWLSQPGHPLIDVQLEANRKVLKLNQSRFVANTEEVSEEEEAQRWLILAKLIVSDGKGRQEVILATLDDGGNGTQVTTVNLPGWFDPKPNSQHWIKMNANFSGFYRTLYSSELFHRLREPVRLRHLPPEDRVNLVDETHALVLANKLGPERLAELLSWMESENHGAVLESAVTAYMALLKLFDDNAMGGLRLRRKLLQFGRILFGSMYGRQFPTHFQPSKADNHSHMLEMGRSAVLSLLVHINHELTLNEAVKTFQESSMRPPAHLRSPYYAAVARNGSELHHGRLMSQLDELDSREELTRLAEALAKAEQQHRLALLWSWLRKSSQASLKLQSDRLDVVSSMLQAGPIGRKFVRQLLEESPDELFVLNGERPVTSLIEELCLLSSGSPKQFEELDSLFVRQKNLIDWSSSRDYIKRMLDWQAKLRSSGAKRLEEALDHYLATGAAAAAAVGSPRIQPQLKAAVRAKKV